MDLRLEAAAISEMAENIEGDQDFRVPDVDWRRTARRVLTVEWIDGIPISDYARLDAAGFDRKALGLTVMRAFLKHAMRDGFFHADMHQGNLFVDHAGPGGGGRLRHHGPARRQGAPLPRRDPATGSSRATTRERPQVHFWAGYVPPHHPVEVFAQALRAIGEPIHGRTAEEISMADLLGQLFAYTEVFDMQTRPELILLQKTMVVVEGVARGLDPSLNMWIAAEPIARQWIEDNLGPIGRLREAGEGASAIGKVLADLPALLTQGQRRRWRSARWRARAAARRGDGAPARPRGGPTHAVGPCGAMDRRVEPRGACARPARPLGARRPTSRDVLESQVP